MDEASDESLFSVETMYGAAKMTGKALRDVTAVDAPYALAQDADVSASFIVGGQIKGRRMRLFQVYSAGNFIEATEDTPYLQIGETKYGKPILERVMDTKMGLMDAAKCAIVSLDSTIRSNISVAPPLDILVYRRDTCRVAVHQRLADEDRYLNLISNQWGEGLRRLYEELPNPMWGEEIS